MGIRTQEALSTSHARPPEMRQKDPRFVAASVPEHGKDGKSTRS